MGSIPIPRTSRHADDVRDGGAGRSRTDLHGFAIRCITALLPRPWNCRQPTGRHSDKKGKPGLPFSESGAGDESRTRDLNLGKVALYQLSYSRVASTAILSTDRSSHYRQESGR